MNNSGRNDARKIRHLEVKNTVMKFGAWDQLKQAINDRDEESLNELVAQLVDALEKTNHTYVKRTFEIREDLLEDLRKFCVIHGYKQKAVINIALETILRL